MGPSVVPEVLFFVSRSQVRSERRNGLGRRDAKRLHHTSMFKFQNDHPAFVQRSLESTMMFYPKNQGPSKAKVFRVQTAAEPAGSRHPPVRYLADWRTRAPCASEESVGARRHRLRAWGGESGHLRARGLKIRRSPSDLAMASKLRAMATRFWGGSWGCKKHSKIL